VSDALDVGLALIPVPGVGMAAAVAGRILASAVKSVVVRAGRGVWSKGIVRRGGDIEDAVGAQLQLGTNLNRRAGTRFFPGIDFRKELGDGRQLLSQVTSLDTGAKRNVGGRLGANVVRRAEALAGRSRFEFGDTVVRARSGDIKQLVVAIPASKLSAGQAVSLVKASRAARTMGVRVRYVVVP
jgi:hypothetical protein